MPDEVRFGVLGPVAAWRGAEAVPLGVGKQAVVLAVLLVRVGEAVDRAEIIDAVWPEQPPRSAVNLVQKYVGDLRRALGPSVGLVSLGARYRLQTAHLDACRFTALVDAARAETDPEAARAMLVTALALWRGEPFSGIDSPAVVVERNRLSEYHLAAREALVEVDLARGEPAAAAAEVARLTAKHPFRERLRELQIQALHASGRRAEALAVYRDVRELLADELGVDPGPALAAAHERVLTADTAPTHRVCQLPPDIPDFTGRDQALDQLTRSLRERCVQVVYGGPGVGKSTLALRAAYAVRSDFPDGVLYLDLFGMSGVPRDPSAMVAELLRALGPTGAAIPDGPHERTALLRSLLADRSALLVLDDAACAAQVRPLLPATGSCSVLVTSRRRLPELVGARHLRLGGFTEQEGRDLVTRLVGDRAAAHPDDVSAILRSCDLLPLAIRIAGAKLAGREGWSPRVLRARLADESRRLGELRVGDLAVRASFDLSRRLLPADARTAFGRLGLLRPVGVAGWAVAPLLDRPDADDAVEALVDAQLLALVGTDQAGQPRYRLHDLLRAYAAELAADEPERERRAAVARLLDTWLDLVERASVGLYPSLFLVPPAPEPRWAHSPGVAAPESAPVAWLDAEHHAALSAIHLAVDWGLPDRAWRLAVAMVPYYDHRNLYVHWRRSHDVAMGAARAAGDQRGEAALLRGIGQVHIYRDEYPAALSAFHRSVALHQEVGDKRGAALAMAGLGTVARVQNRHEEAIGYAMTALDVIVAEGERTVEAQLRSSIASVLLAEGRGAEAEQWFQDALRISRSTGDRHREAAVLRVYGQAHHDRGDRTEALRCLHRALEVFTDLDDERCAAYTLMSIGKLHPDRRRATPALERAAAIFHRAGGEIVGQAECRERAGRLALADGDRPAARPHLVEASRLWRHLGDTTRAAELTALLRS